MTLPSIRLRSLIAALCLAFLLPFAVSCGGEAAGVSALCADVRAASEISSRRAARFQAEASFRDPFGETGSVLYSVSGSVSCDAAAGWGYQSYAGALLASTFKGEDWFGDGICLHRENGTTTRSERETDPVLRGFPFQMIPLPEESEVKTASSAANLTGTLYTFMEDGSSEKLEALCGWDWYAMAGISVPDRSRESFGPLTWRISVRDGKTVSCAAECTFLIYEEAGYTPGRSDGTGKGLELTFHVQWTEIRSGADVPDPDLGGWTDGED